MASTLASTERVSRTDAARPRTLRWAGGRTFQLSRIGSYASKWLTPPPGRPTHISPQGNTISQFS